jgi:hypothetical protein
MLGHVNLLKTLIIVTKLHKFCDEHGLSHRLRQMKTFDIPIKKGAGKGWSVVSKKTIGT